MSEIIIVCNDPEIIMKGREPVNDQELADIMQVYLSTISGEIKDAGFIFSVSSTYPEYEWHCFDESIFTQYGLICTCIEGGISTSMMQELDMHCEMLIEYAVNSVMENK